MNDALLEFPSKVEGGDEQCLKEYERWKNLLLVRDVAVGNRPRNVLIMRNMIRIVKRVKDVSKTH